MRIGILVKEYPPDVIGGAELQTMRMAEILTRDNDVIVFTKKYGKESVAYNRYRIVRIPNIQKNSFLSTLTFVILVIFYIIKYRKKIDLLQCMMVYPSGFIGYILNKFTNLPYFSWIRGGDWYFARRNFLKNILIKIVLSNSNYPVLVQTSKIKRDVLNFCPTANVKIVGNGVNTKINVEKTKNRDKIYFVGNLIKRKGVDVLIRALSGTGWNLVIVGDGPERDKLVTLCNQFSVNCEFRGKVHPDKIQEEIKNAKLLVLPAVEGEGLPNAVLEALAVGIPVIATNLAGIPDVIVNGVNGYIVEPGDVDALREKIMEIMGNVKLQRKMSINARKTAKKYSWDKVIERLKEVYGECVA